MAHQITPREETQEIRKCTSFTDFFFFLAKEVSACARCLILALKSLVRFGLRLGPKQKDFQVRALLWSILVSTDILVPCGINLSRLVRL